MLGSSAQDVLDVARDGECQLLLLLEVQGCLFPRTLDYFEYFLSGLCKAKAAFDSGWTLRLVLVWGPLAWARAFGS